MRQPPGSVPLVHDLAVLLVTFRNASPQNDYCFKVFEASTYTLLLLRLRGQWNVSQLFTQKLALASQCQRLNLVASEPRFAQHLLDVARSASDITTIGCLSFLIEADLQRLLCDTMGAPLVRVIAHLHVI